MGIVAMVARVKFPYARRTLKPGDEFEARNETDALILRELGKADEKELVDALARDEREYVEREAKRTQPAQPAAEPRKRRGRKPKGEPKAEDEARPRRGRYSRRDMIAEGDE